MAKTLINIKIDQWMRASRIAMHKANCVKNERRNQRKNVKCWRYPKYYAAHFNSKPIQNDDRNHCTRMHAFLMHQLMPMRACHWVRNRHRHMQSGRVCVCVCAFHWCAFFRQFWFAHMLMISGVRTHINRIECFGAQFFRLQQVRGPHQSCQCTWIIGSRTTCHSQLQSVWRKQKNQIDDSSVQTYCMSLSKVVFKWSA